MFTLKNAGKQHTHDFKYNADTRRSIALDGVVAEMDSQGGVGHVVGLV